MRGSFVDLRIDAGAGLPAENFWPSFTDVMTVIVMVFMTVSTIFVLRNTRLVEQLQKSIQAETQSALRASSAEEQKLTIEEQLDRARRQLALLSMELTASTQSEQAKSVQLAQTQAMLAQSQQQAGQLSSALTEAQNRAAQTQSQLDSLQAEQTRLKEGYAARERELNASAGQIKILQANIAQQKSEMDALHTASAKQQSELESLRAEDTKSQQNLSALQGDYDALKVRYDKLVRPARSATGRQVAEVRYEKIDGSSKIRYRGPGEQNFAVVSQAELEEKLSVLQKQDPTKLYVKVVIPEDSGLSYNEAWTFTLDLLNKYDYYYH